MSECVVSECSDMCTFEWPAQCSALHSMMALSHWFSGALTPLSAAAAAAAAAGRVALAGQAGSGGVLLVSNLNEEVSPIHTPSHSSEMDRLRLAHTALTPLFFELSSCSCDYQSVFHCPDHFAFVFCLPSASNGAAQRRLLCVYMHIPGPGAGGGFTATLLCSSQKSRRSFVNK